VCGGRIAGVGDLPPKYRPVDWKPSLALEERRPRGDESHVAPELESAPREAFACPDTQTRQAANSSDSVADASAASEWILPEKGIDLRAHLAAIERRLIEQALGRTGGVVAHAALLLNLRRTTLVEKMRKLGMAEPATED
jgi:sigma-54 dependent transcriptional regulator, flagellar regulatory protein